MILLAKIQLAFYLFTIIVIIIGLVNYKKLKTIKYLLLIPIFSLIQMSISGYLLSNNESKLNVEDIIKSTVEIYSCLEFIIIVYFIKLLEIKIIDETFYKIAIITSILLTSLNLTISSDNQNLISDLMHLLEGLIIEILILIILLRQIKKGKISSLLKEPKLISLFGIFNAFLIIWPINTITNFYLKNIDVFTRFHFFSNATGYVMMYTFFIFSIYAIRNRGVN